MKRAPALAIVFASSAAVLVVEIVANRLMAPYVGVSLETFTGIIGVVLAGIATGAAVGGRLADQYDPRRLLPAALGVGGLLVWIAVPIVRALGPSLTHGPVAIVILATAGYFAPAAALSAVTPIVAKLRLSSLDDTGSVFGGLSAAGTAGGLAGTFVTGFVLVTTLGSRTTMFLVGGSMLLLAAVVHFWLLRGLPGVTPVALAIAGGLSVFGFDAACEYETKYACASVVVDDENPSDIDLVLDSARHGNVHLDDPTVLELRYVRLFASVADAMPDGPIDALHLGGGSFTFPRYLEAVRPGSTNLVLELDPGVVDIAEERLGLVLDDQLRVRVGDARTALPDLDDDAFDLIVGDAFAGQSVPWHLTTAEVVDELDRLLRTDGVYVMNVIDGGDNRFARAMLATLRTGFDNVAALLPDDRISIGARNQVLIASNAPIPGGIAPGGDGVLVQGAALDHYIDDADVLTDDHAPADQLSAT